MNPELYASTYEKLRREPAWSLLAAQLSPQVLALLQHLLFSTDRVLPSSVLHDRLATELQELRLHGREIPQNAPYYITSWLREGWLERRLPEGAEEEEFELSTAALQALRLVSALQSTRSVATESRLSLVMEQLAQLAQDTDTNPASRLERLLEERARLDAQIDEVSQGRVPSLAPANALDRIRDIIALSRDLSEDFRRVRDDFSKLNRDFRERIIQEDGQRGELLNDLFSGVDLISHSGPGQSFDAFWKLLTDPEQRARFDAAVGDLSGREFYAQLHRDERLFLRQLTKTLLNRASGVNSTRTGFAKSLRNFVQSKEYQEQRRLSRLLRAAKSLALDAVSEVRPTKQIGFVLQLSAGTYRSIGRYRLFDPTQSMEPVPITEAEEGQIDLLDIAQAIARSEIDFRVLYDNLRSCLGGMQQCSIADVLTAHPATQGLGTVVGYLSIGVKFGVIVDKQRQTVSWSLDDGLSRSASIPLVYFLPERMDELPA